MIACPACLTYPESDSGTSFSLATCRCGRLVTHQDWTIFAAGRRNGERRFTIPDMTVSRDGSLSVRHSSDTAAWMTIGRALASHVLDS